MTREERLAYQRGYQRGMHGRWPDMDTIKENHYRELATAAHDLAQRTDAFISCFDDRDTEPNQVAIDAARDRVADAIERAYDHCAKWPVPVPEETK